MAGAVAALMLAAFFTGRFWPRETPAGPQPIGPQVRERILLVAVGDHLERSQMVLLELVNMRGNGEVDIAAEQQRAEELVAANRIYRQTAARSGEPGVASVLEGLERVLLEVAHSPSRMPAAEFERLRARFEHEGILFKVRVLDTQVRRKANAAL